MRKPRSQSPLFMELPEEHQREDAYSGPHGFVFGGEFVPTRLEMAEQYLHAVRTKYHQKVPSWIATRLDEIAALDPNSMASRYGKEKYVGASHPPVNGLFSALADAARRIGANT